MCPTDSGFLGTTKKPGGLCSTFEVLDVDRIEKISRVDLRSFYGDKLAVDKEDAIMMTVADSNKDGYVEFDEFEKVLNCKREKNGGVVIIEELFRVRDIDGDGKVGHEDLKSYLGWAGFEASDDDDIKARIKLDCENRNGGVTYDGLLKTLTL